ncbi:MAG: hypothetical protein QXN83_01210 [Nitrososphaerales archaeon]
MRVVADTDILSIFAKVERLDILKKLFDLVIAPSVISELRSGRIDIRGLKPTVVKLTGEEIKGLKETSVKLGRGERECFVIARSRDMPLASNDKLVHSLCRKEGISYFTLPRILRFAISERVIARDEARQLVKMIEKGERTRIKDKDEIFR